MNFQGRYARDVHEAQALLARGLDILCSRGVASKLLFDQQFKWVHVSIRCREDGVICISPSVAGKARHPTSTATFERKDTGGVDRADWPRYRRE